MKTLVTLMVLTMASTMALAGSWITSKAKAARLHHEREINLELEAGAVAVTRRAALSADTRKDLVAARAGGRGRDRRISRPLY